MNTAVVNLRKKEIELIPRANELNGGILGLHSDHKIFSIEEHIQSMKITSGPLLC